MVARSTARAAAVASEAWEAMPACTDDKEPFWECAPDGTTRIGLNATFGDVAQCGAEGLNMTVTIKQPGNKAKWLSGDAEKCLECYQAGRNYNYTKDQIMWPGYRAGPSYILFIVFFVLMYLAVVAAALFSTFVTRRRNQKRGHSNKWTVRGGVVTLIGVGSFAKALAYIFLMDPEDQGLDVLKELCYFVKDVCWIGAFCLIILYWVQLQRFVRKSAGLEDMRPAFFWTVSIYTVVRLIDALLLMDVMGLPSAIHYVALGPMLAFYCGLFIMGTYWSVALRRKMARMVAKNSKGASIEARLRKFSQLIFIENVLSVVWVILTGVRFFVDYFLLLKNCDEVGWHFLKMPERVCEWGMMVTLCWTMMAHVKVKRKRRSKKERAQAAKDVAGRAGGGGDGGGGGRGGRGGRKGGKQQRQQGSGPGSTTVPGGSSAEPASTAVGSSAASEEDGGGGNGGVGRAGAASAGSVSGGTVSSMSSDPGPYRNVVGSSGSTVAGSLSGGSTVAAAVQPATTLDPAELQALAQALADKPPAQPAGQPPPPGQSHHHLNGHHPAMMHTLSSKGDDGDGGGGGGGRGVGLFDDGADEMMAGSMSSKDSLCRSLCPCFRSGVRYGGGGGSGGGRSTRGVGGGGSTRGGGQNGGLPAGSTGGSPMLGTSSLEAGRGAAGEGGEGGEGGEHKSSGGDASSPWAPMRGSFSSISGPEAGGGGGGGGGGGDQPGALPAKAGSRDDSASRMGFRHRTSLFQVTVPSKRKLKPQ